MDPNETLRELREMIAEWDSGTVTKVPEGDVDTLIDNLDAHVGAMSSLANALDSWLTSGGFLPEAWSQQR